MNCHSRPIKFFKVIFVITLCFANVKTSQAQYSTTVQKVLQQNKGLNMVLEKYKHDPQKLKAASFLIENLPYHFGYTGETMKQYRKLYELHSTGRYTPERVLDSITSLYGDFSYDQLTTKSDISIDPAYLIENIDLAFKAWQNQPWTKNVSFENFCEYILPYRVGNEELQPWRRKIYEQYNPMLDSIRHRPEAEDPKYVAEVILNILKNRGPFLFSTVFHGPHVGPDLVNWRSGNCRESSDLFLYVCRALGIPCGREVMLMRGSQNVGHEWNFVPDKNGNSYFGSVTYSSNVLEEASTYWNPKGKVYRERFSLNQQMTQPFKEVTDKLYPVFRQPLFTDVTRFYTGKLNHRIEVPADKLYETVPEGTPVYLCLSSWMNWKPVAITKFTNNKALFQDVEGGIAFRLATYENGELVLISDPLFLEKETGELRYIVGLDEDADIVLTHKFRLEWPLADRMVGGVFEGSNHADFSNPDTLYKITKKPVRLWSVVSVQLEKTYRYVRYRGPKDSRCNVSEVAFYEEGKSDVLKGEITGTQNSEALAKTHNYTNVYDGDPNTSFDYYLADGGWAGLDLGMPKKISKIVYTPRNRVNFIYPGNYYELFYERHGEWISAGETEAVSDSISFKVPKGALLYLKNHSGGKDERIFEYINGEAKFW